MSNETGLFALALAAPIVVFLMGVAMAKYAEREADRSARLRGRAE